MTTRLLDGPGVDLTFDLRRAPAYLRVVQGPTKWDALDLPEDEPEALEHVHVYRLVEGTFTQVHVRAAKRSASGIWQGGEYVYVPDAPVELLRNNGVWRAWVTLRQAADLDGRRLPTGVAADLASLDADAFRAAASELGAVERDDCWELTAR